MKISKCNIFLGLANAASNNASLDITVIALLGFCSSQIDILCERLRRFEFSEIEQENVEYLRICARHHNKIIKYVFRVSKIMLTHGLRSLNSRKFLSFTIYSLYYTFKVC